MRKWPLIILIIFAFFIFLAVRYELFFNLRTSSLPVGIYQRVHEQPKVGSYVSSCLTKEIARGGLKRGYLIKGRCATGIQPVLKKVYAAPGDVVSVTDDFVTINGEVLKDISILSTDSKGRQVKRLYLDNYILMPSEYFLLSDYKINSWDSRYWGPAPVDFVLKPLVVLDE